MTKIAKGRQGSWFAEVNGKPGLQLPVLQKEYWGVGNSYHDPYPRYLELAQGRKYLEALKQGLALVAINTKVGKRKGGGEGWKREAYMNSVFKVANVTYSPAEGLRLNFVGSTSAALI
jgi:hypothetical protein